MKSTDGAVLDTSRTCMQFFSRSLTRCGQRYPLKFGQTIADVLVNTVQSANTYGACWISFVAVVQLQKCCGRSIQSSFVVNMRHYLAFVRYNSPLITSSKIRSPRTDVLASTFASSAFSSYLVKDSMIVSCVHSRNPVLSMT